VGAVMAKDANGHGRNPKIDPDTVDRLCQAIRTGATLEASAAYAGIAESTLHLWLSKGRAVRAAKVYRDFAAAVELALATFEVTAIARITKAGEKEWTADAWRLERRYPDRYGRRTRIDGNVQLQAAPMIDREKLSDEELELLQRLLEKGRPDEPGSAGAVSRSSIDPQSGAGGAALALLPGGQM
jgi:transposase